VFPTERKISRRAKKKSTLDVDDFSVLLRHHWIYSNFFRHVTGTPRQRKRKFPIQSDLPQLVSLNDLPNTVCWRDIELFLLRNPDGDRDVVCVIVEFRNLKGRPEGADG
jgi:hypothetical protein